MKKLVVFLVVCVYVAALAVCCVAAYDDEAIVAARIAEQNRLKILNEQYKASKALDVKLSREEVSLAYYNESNNGDSESSPYIIDSSSDLKLLQERVNSGIEPSGKYYRLDSDIDLSSETKWTGIGFLTHPFDGHFDGNHKTITVNNNGTIITTGPFYTIKSSGTAVKDLTVKGTVKSSSTTVNGSVSGATAAGIVYELTSGILENCVFNGTVEAESTASNSTGNAAGILAIVQSAGSVKNCSFNGTVKATGGYSALGAHAGGIVDTQYGTVSGCTTSSGSTVYASGGTSYAGGITGFAMNGNISITGCTSNATISGATYKGGILGRGTSSTVLSGNSYTGADKEVGDGSTNGNSGNTGSSYPYIPEQTIPGTAVGQSYEHQLTATGTTPMRWSLYTGSLPDGLSLSESGKISGRAQKAGTYPFTVKVENSVGYNIGYGRITVVAASYGTSSSSGGGGCNAGFGIVGFMLCTTLVLRIKKGNR